MLILVVGPSGAGKDTLLSGARLALADKPNVRFVRRAITRPAEAGGEDHDAVTDETFDLREHALQWGAHGLRYGIPRDIEHDLARGRTVIANVSRGIIAEAAGKYPTRVILITASPDVLARRLAARGRESDEDIAARLAREMTVPEGVAVETIYNDASPEEGVARFVAAINRAAESAGR